MPKPLMAIICVFKLNVAKMEGVGTGKVFILANLLAGLLASIGLAFCICGFLCLSVGGARLFLETKSLCSLKSRVMILKRVLSPGTSFFLLFVR